MPRSTALGSLCLLLAACGGPEALPEAGTDEAALFLPAPRPGTWRWFEVGEPPRTAGVRDLGRKVATDGSVLAASGENRVDVYRRTYRADTSQGWPWTYRTAWTHEQTLTRPAASDGDWGANVDVLGDWLVVAARRNTPDGEGYVDVFRFVDGAWAFQQRILKSSLFTGYSRDRCCQVKLAQDRLLIGDDDHAGGTGVVFVLERDPAGTYVQTDTLTRPDPMPREIDWHFGYHMEVDGDALLVSSIRSIGRTPNRVYLFRYDGSAYALEHAFDAPTGAGDGGFGYRVGIRGDRVAVVQTNTQVVRIYERTGGVWPSQPTGTVQTQAYPSTMAFDGQRLVLARTNLGAADAYTRTGPGVYAWQQRLQIPAGTGGATSVLALDIAADHLVLGGANHGLLYIGGDRTGALRAHRWHNGLCPLVGGAYRCP